MKFLILLFKYLKTKVLCEKYENTFFSFIFPVYYHPAGLRHCTMFASLSWNSLCLAQLHSLASRSRHTASCNLQVNPCFRTIDTLYQNDYDLSKK
jgi:hypothetical protein